MKNYGVFENRTRTTLFSRSRYQLHHAPSLYCVSINPLHEMRKNGKISFHSESCAFQKFSTSDVRSPSEQPSSGTSKRQIQIQINLFHLERSRRRQHIPVVSGTQQLPKRRTTALLVSFRISMGVGNRGRWKKPPTGRCFLHTKNTIHDLQKLPLSRSTRGRAYAPRKNALFKRCNRIYLKGL